MTKSFQENISQISLVYKNKVKAIERPKVCQSSDAYRIFRENWNDLTINLFEEFKVLLLDNSNRCMGISTISKGGLTSTLVDTRLIFALALKARSHRILLGHNHPSQNPNPSSSDIELTEKLIEAGKLLDIQILDHIIVNDENYTSFSDKGICPF